jgi:putative transposase
MTYAPDHEKGLLDRSQRRRMGLELHIPAPNKRGRPKTHTTREILDAIFYVLKSGCPLAAIAPRVPALGPVYWWFGGWRLE